ncbi:AraC family transcriptional regulator [Sphingobacterium siyangense]|uniref:helix-turn-helix domain-containing protein n=1 Tax=Sphingobacterium siyangense TaxID=459529 RepID=UPI002FDE2E4C
MNEIVIIESCEEEIYESKITKHKPQHCKFPVLRLPWYVFQHTEVIISKQSRNLMGANMQLFEFDAKKAAVINFKIVKASTFLFFHLRGNAAYYINKNILITKMAKPTFYLTYSPEIQFKMKISRGHHAILAIALEEIWSFTTDELSPIFDDFYASMLNGSDQPIVLPHKRITKEVWSILGRLRLTAVRNIEDNIGLLKQISLCLSTYYRYVVEDNKNNPESEEIIGERIRRYLQDHYMFEDECRLNIIQRKFNLSEWQLRKIAKNVFGSSIGQYLNNLRLEKSIQLLLETDLTVNEITVRIGYTSPTTFSNYFRNKTGYSPTTFRKKSKKAIQN